MKHLTNTKNFLSNIIEIHILLYGNKTKDIKSYNEVNEIIHTRSDTRVYTYCTDFFCFDYLAKNIEVIVWKDECRYIKLSELLNKNEVGNYINKNIRECHNARKMLLAGSFNFKENFT